MTSSICEWIRPGSPAGESAIRPTMPCTAFSTITTCSRVSAIDQRSGAGLKFHCASSRQFTAWRRSSRVEFRYWLALDISLMLKSEQGEVSEEIAFILTPSRFIAAGLPQSDCRKEHQNDGDEN